MPYVQNLHPAAPKHLTTRNKVSQEEMIKIKDVEDGKGEKMNLSNKRNKYCKKKVFEIKKVDKNVKKFLDISTY